MTNYNNVCIILFIMPKVIIAVISLAIFLFDFEKERQEREQQQLKRDTGLTF